MANWLQTPKWPAVYGGAHRVNCVYATNTYKKYAPAILYLHGVRWNLTGQLFRIEQLHALPGHHPTDHLQRPAVGLQTRQMLRGQSKGQTVIIATA